MSHKWPSWFPGSGKTLAYLLPAVDMLLRRRSHQQGQETVNTPSIIILTPSRELADQVTVSSKH